MDLRPTGVYVQTNENGHITAIGSDFFLPGIAGWQRIDEGFGERYDHAQGQYLPLPVYDEEGHANWKLEGGKPSLRTDAEKAADVQPDAKVPFEPDADDIARLEMRMEAFDQSLDMLLLGVTEDG